MTQQDDFPAELERAYARIEELEREVEERSLQLKRLLNHDWWQTYRAALTGNHAFRYGGGEGMSTSEAHEESVAAANLAHGPLGGKPHGHTE